MADTGTLTVDDLRTLERSIMESPSCANSILKLLDALTLKTTEDGKRLLQLLMGVILLLPLQLVLLFLSMAKL